MKSIKRFVWTVATGGLIGAVLFAWFSPGAIKYYFSPPADLALSCTPAVEWAIQAYRKVILGGVLVGAITAAILFVAFGSRGKAPVDGEAGSSKGDRSEE